MSSVQLPPNYSTGRIIDTPNSRSIEQGNQLADNIGKGIVKSLDQTQAALAKVISAQAKNTEEALNLFSSNAKIV